jgi:ribose transport system substrate-binding protein
VAVEENAGAKSVWSKYPGLTVIPAYGNWTPSITSSAILQTLATHPGKIDAVWTTGSESWYVVQAFQKAGRPVPYVTDSPEANTLALIHSDPARYANLLFGDATVPVPVADYAFEVTMRALYGQGPKISPIMFPLTPWQGSNIKGWYASCMTQGSEAPFPVPPQAPLTLAQMNAYFGHGASIPPYSYTSTLPSAC